MLNDPTTVEDEARVGSPSEPNEDTRRFKAMPDTSQEKQEVIEKCLRGDYVAFEKLLGEDLGIILKALLEMHLPRYANKASYKYTIEQAEICINFANRINERLETAVDEMDLGEINDLFLRADFLEAINRDDNGRDDG